MKETSLEEKFDAAVKVIRNLPKDGPYQPSSDMQLRFYGLFKQATEGPCNKPQPSFWQVVNRAKWDAWKGMSSMSKEDAMLQYVEELKKQVVETMPLTEDVSDFVSVASPLMDIIEDASREDDGSVSDDTSDTKGESKGDSPQMRASMLEDPYTYDSGSDTEDFHDTQTATQVPRLEIYQDRQVPGPRSNTHSKTGEELKNRLQDILMQLEANAQHLERIERLIKQRDSHSLNSTPNHVLVSGAQRPSDKEQKKSWWPFFGFSSSSVAFFILWPLIVHILFRVVHSRRHLQR